MATAQRLICPACNGMGYTQQTCPEMELRYNPQLGAHVEAKTLQQGSGCIRCLGVGYLDPR
jgi:hypothetical protein